MTEHMRYRHRPYSGTSDLRQMQSLSQRLWSPASRWHPGELVWLRLHAIGREAQWNTSLWYFREQLVAWAWARQPAHLDLQLDPEHIELADDILRWFDDVTAAEAGRTVTVLDAETGLIDALRRNGYREQTDGPFYVHLGRDLTDLPQPELPGGYTLHSMLGVSDADARARLDRAAFSQPPDTLNGVRYREIMRTWPYRPELDRFVAAPDGTPAAFCLAWLDEQNRVAVLEPVGTAPGHRRLGLATAAILSALQAAETLGADYARVCARGNDDHRAARSTYESLGFRRYATNLTWSREA